MMRALMTLTLIATLAPSGLFGDDDAEGCKDSPLITRMPGSTLTSCDHKDFDQLTVTVTSPDGRQDKQLEGDVSGWQYGYREGASALQVERNILNAIKAAGLTVVYEASGDTITARKGETWFFFQFYDNSYDQHIVVVKAMDQEVTADATQLKGELETSGHVAVYGIHFDTGTAAILPDSEPTLNQIVALLEAQPDLKLSIEGHTDSQGAKASNKALSEKRAQGVVDWLTAHGIARARLSAAGFGDTKPVGDNGTDEGRAKNRRVELVKRT